MITYPHRPLSHPGRGGFSHPPGPVQGAGRGPQARQRLRRCRHGLRPWVSAQPKRPAAPPPPASHPPITRRKITNRPFSQPTEKAPAVRQGPVVSFAGGLQLGQLVAAAAANVLVIIDGQLFLGAAEDAAGKILLENDLVACGCRCPGCGAALRGEQCGRGCQLFLRYR